MMNDERPRSAIGTVRGAVRQRRCGVSIGETLAEARRQAGLTVASVSQRTRIREAIIRGIEGNDYSACGGDFYARGHIRSIAKVVGTDPEPLISEYDKAHRAPGALAAVSMPELVTPARPPRRRRLNWFAMLGLALAAALGFVVYSLLPGSRAASAPPTSGTHVVSGRHAAGSRKRPAASTSQRLAAAVPSSRPAVPAHKLTPVSAAAFGPYGAGQGDNPQLAPLAIDAALGTAWHTDWYTTARFGNLYPATGLLLDMGRPVTITGALITLGGAPGADLELRVGAAAALPDLRPVARAADASGVLRLRLAGPAHGRYVLVWFTGLPPDPAGTFQAAVYDVRLEGRQ
jgi:hypothetical protein